MKLGALRCPACGRVRYVSARERGATVACDGCAGTIDVPSSLALPGYADVYRELTLALRLERIAILSIFVGCVPAAAWAWWMADGAIGRCRDDGRPVVPPLLRARRTAVIVTALQILGLGAALLVGS